MSYVEDDPDPDDVDDNVPGWLSWPNLPIISLTLGTVLGWYRAWRNR